MDFKLIVQINIVAVIICFDKDTAFKLESANIKTDSIVSNFDICYSP